MKTKLTTIIAATAIAPLIGFAVQSVAWADGYNSFGHNWGSGYLGGGHMVFGGLMSIVVIAVIITAVVAAVRWTGGQSNSAGLQPQRSAMAIRRRAARRGVGSGAPFARRLQGLDSASGYWIWGDNLGLLRDVPRGRVCLSGNRHGDRQHATPDGGPAGALVPRRAIEHPRAGGTGLRVSRDCLDLGSTTFHRWR